MLNDAGPVLYTVGLRATVKTLILLFGMLEQWSNGKFFISSWSKKPKLDFLYLIAFSSKKENNLKVFCLFAEVGFRVFDVNVK